jgi:hypothetical protein
MIRPGSAQFGNRENQRKTNLDYPFCLHQALPGSLNAANGLAYARE